MPDDHTTARWWADAADLAHHLVPDTRQDFWARTVPLVVPDPDRPEPFDTEKYR